MGKGRGKGGLRKGKGKEERGGGRGKGERGKGGRRKEEGGRGKGERNIQQTPHPLIILNKRRWSRICHKWPGREATPSFI